MIFLPLAAPPFSLFCLLAAAPCSRIRIPRLVNAACYSTVPVPTSLHYTSSLHMPSALFSRSSSAFAFPCASPPPRLATSLELSQLLSAPGHSFVSYASMRPSRFHICLDFSGVPSCLAHTATPPPCSGPSYSSPPYSTHSLSIASFSRLHPSVHHHCSGSTASVHS